MDKRHEGSRMPLADWSPAVGPLKTRWAGDVDPAAVLPEYPRPQMVRQEWLNLNGLWDIELGDGTRARVLVPFAIESALSGLMKHADRMVYRRRFVIPEGWNGRRVLLHFGAVDWEATVAVNGRQLGVHRGGYDAFCFDITDALLAAGEQEVAVEVFDPTENGGQPRGKQALKQGSILYTPTSGIWQTVWLEPVMEAHVRSLQLVPDVDRCCLRLIVEGAGTVEAVASEGGEPVGRVVGAAGSELTLAIADPTLWSPETPHLYDLTVSLKSGDEVVDTVTSYFGMRQIALGRDEHGITRLMLNGKATFQVGPLDQGFWPDGLYTAPTDEALRWDIQATKALGFNCTRKHIKVEPSRWYYWCDRLGLMVWQDMPSVNSYTAEKQPIDVPQFKVELARMVEDRRNHPCIIMWVVFNESQGQHDTESLVAAVKRLDPSRLVSNASGGTDRNCGDIVDVHAYPGPEAPGREAHRAAVLGEFGGLGLAVPGHRWTEACWGYADTESGEALTRGYEALLAKAWALKDGAGLAGVIYTQLTDVETEVNGLVTYDREIEKAIAGRVAAANRGDAACPSWQEHGEKAPGSDYEKSNYSPGIFNSVELVLSGAPHIERVQAVPDIDRQSVAEHTWLLSGVRFDCPAPEVFKLTSEIFESCIMGKVEEPRGTLAHRWIKPGGGYNGQWVWDTMFVVDLLSVLPGQEPLIREVFQNYWDFQERWNRAMPGYAHDMIPCAMFPDDVNWVKFPAYSQIPLLAWGVERVYRRNRDCDLVRQALAPLERFHEWYWRERDVLDAGLVTVGTYLGGAIQHARWETFDYACDLDGLALTKHPTRKGEQEGEWYGDICVPGNTAYLIMAERSLRQLALGVNDRELAARRQARIDKAVEAMRAHMWDEKAGLFLSVQRDTLEKIRVGTIGSWIPLVARVPTEAMAARMAETLRTPGWDTPLPVPTVDRNDGRWQSDGALNYDAETAALYHLDPALAHCWRGDVWPATNYQIATGLAQYGFKELAARIADKTIANAMKHGISEYYDSVSGKALGVPWLGMSCSIVTMMLDGLSREHRLRCKPANEGDR